MSEELAILFCEKSVSELEDLSRTIVESVMAETSDGSFVRLSSVFLATRNPERLCALIETHELIALVKKFSTLTFAEPSTDEEMFALRSLSMYGGDTWQWILDAFEGNSEDNSICSTILSIASQAWNA